MRNLIYFLVFALKELINKKIYKNDLIKQFNNLRIIKQIFIFIYQIVNQCDIIYHKIQVSLFKWQILKKSLNNIIKRGIIMKIKYVIIFVMLLIAGNFLRLLIEDKNTPEIEINREKNYKKDKAKKDTDLTKSNVKFDINSIEYKDLLKLGINKNKAEKFVKYRDEVGVIKDVNEVKNISGFGKSGLEIAQKFLFVDDEKIQNSKQNYGREITKYNINKLNEKELKKIGFTNKEIKKLLPEIEKNNIRSNVELEKIIGKERYAEIEDKIKFILRKFYLYYSIK